MIWFVVWRTQKITYYNIWCFQIEKLKLIRRIAFQVMKNFPTSVLPTDWLILPKYLIVTTNTHWLYVFTSIILTTKYFFQQATQCLAVLSRYVWNYWLHHWFFLFCHLIIFCLNLYSLNIIHTDIKPENILFANGK